MRKPSEVEKMEVSISNLIFDGYAMMYFGEVLASNEKVKEMFDKNERNMMDHEMIHVKQAVSTGDSFIKFYLLWVLKYLKAIVLMIYGTDMPYLLNPFEMEAYAFENVASYTSGNTCEAWKLFDKLSWKDKFRIAREYKNRTVNRSEFFKGVYNDLVEKYKAKGVFSSVGELIKNVKK